jgi:hypothetical protein
MANEDHSPNVDGWSLQRATKLNPRAAAFFAGVAILVSVVSYVASLKLDTSTWLPVSIVILLLGMIIHVVTAGKKLGVYSAQAQVLFWFAVVVFMFAIIAYLVMALTGKPTPVPCAISPGSKDCKVALSHFERETIREYRELEEKVPANLDMIPTESKSSIGTLQIPKSSPQAKNFANLSLYVQFSGYPRASIVNLSRGLRDAGWSVQGADRGGERLESAQGFNEVRFREGNRAAATLLAEQINATSALQKRVVLNQTNLVNPDTLELWVSQ